MSATPHGGLPRASPPATAVYRPRRPEKTVFYQVVQPHLETWLARVREADPDHGPLPLQGARRLSLVQYLAHGFECSTLGGPCVSSGAGASVGIPAEFAIRVITSG
jgi:hypothetical protein